MHDDQLQRICSAPGFIAALDQSGGSTPGALAAYGIDESQYSNDAEMFDLMHAMRARIMMSASFDHRVLGAILFEMTLDRDVAGMPTATYLWSQKQVVPFLKVDKGLTDLENGVQLMRPNPGLDDLLARAVGQGVFGTKMRSVISNAVVAGVHAVVDQQFAVAQQIIEAGLVPIIEPEISIGCPDKAEAEALLRERIEFNLAALPGESRVMFKLTLPDQPNFYAELMSDRRVVRVVALSGGYSRAEANGKLAENAGMIASFSRALAEGLSHGQTDTEFDATLDTTIESIHQASNS